ncbi:MAG TPA: PAS domain-containing sensor histidine kinase [Candidatus Melainabacteria bacterium]|nr:PAS domain-containing sensor histidine kinase [Candidatus Melainabacteria bacterium]HIN64104.1 PAS domain-containing sensor histidine kinase [Candidatus Obscuribacterales bacterium]
MSDENILESLEGVIWEAELAPFHYSFVSSPAKRLLGHSAEDILQGKTNFINPKLKAALAQGVEISADWYASCGAAEVYEWQKPTGEKIYLKDQIRIETTTKGTKLYGLTIDLTEFVQQERKERADQQIIFDSVPAMIWYKDRHNIILRANKPAAESMGYTVETIVGKSTYDLYPEDAEKYYQDDLSVINSGESRLGIVDRYVNSSGEILWLQTDKIPLRDKAGNIQGVMVFSQDVTDRKRAEERLLSAHADLETKVEERTRELTEANIFFTLSHELFCIAGFDGHFKQLNPQWTKVLGYSVEELKARPYLDFVHPEDREATLAQAEILSQGKHIHFFENRYLAKDGTIKWLMWSVSSDLNNSVVYAVAHDITQRRQTEAQLEDVSARINNVARHLPGVIYQFLKKKSDGSYHFPYISESCRALLGYERHEIEQDSNLAFVNIHPDDQGPINEAIERSAQTMSAFKFEMRVMTGSTLKVLRATSTPEYLENGDVLWNGLLMDISDLKTAEDKVKQLNEDLAQRVSILAAVNQELEILTHKLELAYDEALEASKLKSEFVANISHEVRTPISAVLGMTELLMDTSLSNEQSSFVKIVNESAQSLLTIINDILDFSKMEAGRLELEVIDLNVRSIVEGCADWLASSARRKRLALMTFCDPSIPQFVKGDPVRLRQVLLNLASNAIKFTENGEILVKASKFRETDERVVILFQVTDTGIGLSEAARKRLFQPFAQADGSTTRKYGGTGLGLSISKRLVEMMGGEIGVSSEEKKGSTFWFTVPLEREKWPAQPDMKAEQLQVLVPFDVLVIDSSTSSRSIISSYLSSAGIKVAEAGSPEEAHQLLSEAERNKSHFTVTIVDSSQGNFDGFELSQKIIESHSEVAGRVVLVASFDEKERMEKAVTGGVAACLVKPLRRAHLLEVVLKPGFRGQEILSMPESVELGLDSALDDLVYQGHSLAEIPAQNNGKWRVLLAEDNPVLQQLAERQLRKFGLDVVIVSNGQEAVQEFEKQSDDRFDAIFMDCQMPEMDGYEATVEIRRLEETAGGRVPIVAMTAGAMPSDRERCIRSGMDDYLSKPVGHDQLRRVIASWIPLALNASTSATTPTAETREMSTDGSQQNGALNSADAKESPPINLNELRKLYGDDDLHDILKMFLSEATELLASVRTQIDSRSDRELAATAHQLKGLSAVLCADNLTRLSLEIEQSAKKSAWEPAESCLGLLQEEFKKVKAFVNDYLKAS